MRVEIWNGDGKTYLGEGNYAGNVDTWAFQTPDGISSLPNAERRPSETLTQSMKTLGHSLVFLSNNPKIEMDDGTIRYGCQVWWKPVSPPQIFKKYLERILGKMFDVLGREYPQKRRF